MDLLLWRWSTAVQLSSLAMIAAFATAMARSDPRIELRWWMRASLANLVALGITLFFWFAQPAGAAVEVALFSYIAAKTAFAVWSLQAAWTIVRPGSLPFSTRTTLAGIALWAVAGALLTSTIAELGAAQHAILGVLFVVGGLTIVRVARRLTWLTTSFLIRGVLALAEMAAYVTQLVPPTMVAEETRAKAATFVASSSFFDTGTEWFIALAFVLAITDRVQRELRQSNAELMAAQSGLRELADRDPLTTLANRRMLPEVFRAAQPVGAMLLFFDLDDFKAINDRHGHARGDECLKRFAAILRESFRPTDAALRYGGDEFLVVAIGMDESSAMARVGAVKDRIALGQGETPLHFSLGMARLAPGGHPDEALRAADKAMYRAKGESRLSPDIERG